MKQNAAQFFPFPFPSQLAVMVLASAISVPLVAQQEQPNGNSQTMATSASQQNSPTSSSQQQPSASASQANTDKEGFWGHMNPFARKKWVNKRVDPLKDRLSELDELSAKNSRDIQDVDARSQAGIRKAQSSADAANQTATAASDRAQRASSTAEGANSHVNQLGETVSGIDQYHPVTEVDVNFRGGQPVLTAAARKQLDDLASQLAGRSGYVVEIEGHSPGSGSIGIQNSARLTEAVRRYLVTEHQIPVYRLHSVALGNVKANEEDAKPVRTSNVHIRLMENSLAAQGTASPQGEASLTGAERR